MKLTKKQDLELQSAWRQRNKEFRRVGVPAETYDQYLSFVFGHNSKVKPDFTKKLRDDHKVSRGTANCIKDWTVGTCGSKPTHSYTGKNMIGVSIIHKSCLQPIFNEEAAHDAASMRR